jgi:hypothetical protein
MARPIAKASAKKPKDAAGASSFMLVAAAFARDRHVIQEPGWGASNLVLKVDRRIFAMLVKGKFVAKLPKERVDELIREGTGVRFDAGRGKPMKEWVVVGTGRASWVDLAREAHRFVKQAQQTPPVAANRQA